MNYLKYFRYLLPILIKNNPLHLTVFVTNICNFKCKMCFNHKNLNTLAPELTLDEYRKISASIKPFFWLLISGGEPFLRKDLAQICSIFHKNNSVANITIPTNGWYTNDIVAQTSKIVKDNPQVSLNIVINIEGSRDVHDQITGINGSFDRAMETARQLAELKKYPNFFLGAALTYSGGNQFNFESIVDLLIDMKTFDSITASLARGDVRDIDMMQYNVNNFTKAMNKVINLYQDGSRGYARGKFDLFSSLYQLAYGDMLNVFENNKWLNPCFAGTLNAVILPNGDVFPCELLNEKLGNLKEVNFDFSRIWYSQKTKDIRKKIKDSKCKCYHICYVTTNILFNLKRMIGVIWGSIYWKFRSRKRFIKLFNVLI